MPPEAFSTLIQGLTVALLSGVGAVIYKTSHELTRITEMVSAIKETQARHDRELMGLRETLDSVHCRRVDQPCQKELHS